MESNTTAQRAIIDHRRSQVARYRLRGESQREIVDVLAKAGHRNPDTGEPWTLFTVNRDCQALDREWREDAARAVEAHKAQVLAELAQVKRAAWSVNNLDTVLKAIAQERTIRGLDAPVKQEVEVRETAQVVVYIPDNGRDAVQADD